MRKESVLSIAQSARRMGSVVVIVGEQNLRILCEVAMHTPSGLKWYADNTEVTAVEIARLLDDAQGA
ncbi:hypothetical protein [Caballeronia sp. KNU42]